MKKMAILLAFMLNVPVCTLLGEVGVKKVDSTFVVSIGAHSNLGAKKSGTMSSFWRSDGVVSRFVGCTLSANVKGLDLEKNGLVGAYLEYNGELGPLSKSGMEHLKSNEPWALLIHVALKGVKYEDCPGRTGEKRYVDQTLNSGFVLQPVPSIDHAIAPDVSGYDWLGFDADGNVLGNAILFQTGRNVMQGDFPDAHSRFIKPWHSTTKRSFLDYAVYVSAGSAPENIKLRVYYRTMETDDWGHSWKCVRKGNCSTEVSRIEKSRPRHEISSASDGLRVIEGMDDMRIRLEFGFNEQGCCVDVSRYALASAIDSVRTAIDAGGECGITQRQDDASGSFAGR